MAKCEYCHADMTPDNLHEECERKHEKGMQELEELYVRFIRGFFPLNETTDKQFQIVNDGYLKPIDIKQCAINALKRIAETADEKPYHLIEKRAKQLVDYLREKYNDINIGELDTASKDLAGKLVKGYYKAYFTEGISEFHVMKNVHMVTQVLPLGEEKEAAICKEVLDEAKQRHDNRIDSFVEAFINYQSPFLNSDENVNA